MTNCETQLSFGVYGSNSKRNVLVLATQAAMGVLCGQYVA